jgi:hypothetical protein
VLTDAFVRVTAGRLFKKLSMSANKPISPNGGNAENSLNLVGYLVFILSGWLKIVSVCEKK